LHSNFIAWLHVIFLAVLSWVHEKPNSRPLPVKIAYSLLLVPRFLHCAMHRVKVHSSIVVKAINESV
jgi:hypothetical protein